MRWLVRAAALVVAAAILWWSWQRVFVTDETRIRRLLSTMTRAVEQGNLLRLEAGIATDYSDDYGLDKSTLLGAVRSFRAQYDAILILLSDLTVTIEPNHQQAQVVFIGKVLAKAKGSFAESELRADRYRLFLRKTDQGWRLYRAESPELKFN